MKRITRYAAITGVVIVVGVSTPAVALAAQPSPSGGSFGQHVSTCAQTMGFNGEHNPGMHRGFADWNGMACEADG